MTTETTTRFIGDIMFNNGEKDVLASDLATVDEVNEALSNISTRVVPYPSHLVNHIDEEYDKHYQLTPIKGITKIHVKGSLTSRIDSGTYEFDLDIDLPPTTDNNVYKVWYTPTNNDLVGIVYLTDNSLNKYVLYCVANSSEAPPSMFNATITIADKYAMISDLTPTSISTDVFVASDPAPSDNGSGYDFNNTFKYDDNSVLSTLANKILINKICTNLLNNYVPNSVLTSTLSDYINTSTLTSTLSEYVAKIDIGDLAPYPNDLINQINNNSYAGRYELTPIDGVTKLHLKGHLISSAESGVKHEFDIDINLPPKIEYENTYWYTPSNSDYIYIQYEIVENVGKYFIGVSANSSRPPPSEFIVDIQYYTTLLNTLQTKITNLEARIDALEST